ncbi:MAG: hypothetical protein KA914_02320 [Ottowia sp.]|nr:hypothetical protein [Ottowia sp.]
MSSWINWSRHLVRGGIAALALAALPAWADICRVTTDGAAGNAGADWRQPTTLASALARSACTEIWVAKGTYTGTGTIAFQITRNLQLYGGFEGNEIASTERATPIDASVTVLDGEDLRQVLVIDGTTGNSATTGSITSATVIEGLTITRGRAFWGGGIQCKAMGSAQPALTQNRTCNPTIRQVRFVANFADFGGALFLDAQTRGNASPTLTDVVFDGNGARTPVAVWTTGGAIYVSVDSNGQTSGTASPTISNATFVGNQAARGGAIHLSTGGSGGIASPVITNATFSGNLAIAPATNPISYGGAIYISALSGASALRLNQVTFSGNQATGTNQLGGAIYATGRRATPVITNSLFWANQARSGADIYAEGSATATVTSTTLQQTCAAPACSDISTADPQLAALANNGGFGQTMLPAVTSPVLALGAAVNCPATDQRGQPRAAGQNCTQGAVERTAPVSTLSLSHSGPGYLATTNGPTCTTQASGACSATGSGSVTIRAFANANSELASWGGACQGTAGSSCTLALGTSQTASAVFRAITFTVGGTINGASGPVTLLNNGGDTLSLPGSVPFTFATGVVQGGSYSVTVQSAPPGQTCVVSNGTGSNLMANVTGVQVNCTSDRYTLSGRATGLAGGGLQLTNHGETISVAADGPFAFSQTLGYNQAYAVTVSAQPAGYTCSVSNGSGSATASVTNVAVDCVVNTYTIGGTVSDLTGSGLVLQNNGADDSAMAANGPFTFGAAVSHGNPYAVTVAAQPDGQRCTASQNSGNATANVTNVAVTCAPYVEGSIVPMPGAPGGMGSASFVGGGPACRFDMAQTGFIAAPAAPPPGQALPQGMFRFRVVGCTTGSTVTMTVNWPQPVTGYTKYGSPAVGAPLDYFEPDGLSVAGQTATFSVTDGGRGDGDAADGAISDPTGPTTPAGTVAVPALGTWALMLLAALAAMVGGVRLRQRRV